jgi:hypothetical protein
MEVEISGSSYSFTVVENPFPEMAKKPIIDLFMKWYIH